MEQLTLNEIGQIAVHVNDITKSTEFYRDILGMNLIFEAPNLAFFENGEVRLMLGSAEGEPHGDRAAVYYRVDDIDTAFVELKTRGVEFSDEPHLIHEAEGYSLRMAFFKDPDGNQLAIMDERGQLA
jgi:catechol 2,3-dioxygenase-like lactoylglutathione lyase family enzyme